MKTDINYKDVRNFSDNSDCEQWDLSILSSAPEINIVSCSLEDLR